MSRFLSALPVLLAALLAAPTVPAHADPSPVPDYDSHPKAAAADFTVRPGLAYSVRGFRTPSGIYCTSSNHRDMYALNCTGPFAGLPDDANWVNLSASGPVVRTITYSKSESVPPGEIPKFEDTPIPLLPEGVLYAFDSAKCMYSADILLTCKMQSRDDPDAKYTGFIATTEGITTFGLG